MFTSWWITTCISKQGERSRAARLPHLWPFIRIISRWFRSRLGLVYSLSSRQCCSYSLSSSFINPARPWISWMSCTDREEAEGEECSPARGSPFTPGDSGLDPIITDLMKQGESGEGLDLNKNSHESAWRCFVFHRDGLFTAALCRCLTHQTSTCPLLHWLTLIGVKHWWRFLDISSS